MHHIPLSTPSRSGFLKMLFDYARSQHCEQRLLALSWLSFRMAKLGSHWMDFYEISYFMIDRKSAQKIQVSLTSGKNSGYFT